jgi:voltage-gated potassium channel Kch
VTLLYFSAAAALLLLLSAAWRRERRLRRRSRLLGEILDLADALERELLECRARLREIPALTMNLPPSEQLSARATLAAEPQVQDALRDLLAHRLWLKEHAVQAGIDELLPARDALVATRAALGAQLARLADVRADFEQVRVPR